MKFRLLLLTILICCFAGSLQAQYNGTVIPYRKDSLWGFCDTSKNLIAPLKYDRTWWFSEGLARVRKNNKFGFVNRKGEEIIPLIYDKAEPFREGLSIVCVNDSCGFINKKGEAVIPLIYNDVKPFSEGLSAVYAGDSCGYVNKKGELVIPIIYYSGASFSRGRARVALNKPTKGTWGMNNNISYGFINASGKVLVPLIYKDRPQSIGEGCYKVETTTYEKQIIDSLGNVIFTNGYVSGYQFSEGLISVYRDRKYGCINSKGEMVVPLRYTAKVGYFKNGMAKVKLDKKFGYVDSTGKEFIPTKYESIGEFRNGLAPAQLNGKYGIIDRNNSVVSPFEYDKINDFKEGIAIAEKGGKYGCIDTLGEIVTPFKYEEITLKKYGLTIAKRRGKYGFINDNNEWVISPKYDFAEDLRDDGYFQAGYLDYYDYFYDFGELVDSTPVYRLALIDSSGKELFRPKYEEIENVNDGMVWCIYKGLKGIVDLKGATIIPFLYDETSWYFDYNGNLDVESKTRKGTVDLQNREVIPVKYHSIKEINSEFAFVKWFDEYGYIGTNGTEYFDIKAPGTFPFTASRKVTEADLKGLSKWDLTMMRNEIYARYGYRFKHGTKLYTHFEAQPWYEIYEYDDSNPWVSTLLTDLEKKNVYFIKAHEDKLKH
jgi:hypothetical protein